MRVVVQRSLASKVEVDGTVVGSINKGLVLLVGFTQGDNTDIVDKMVDKILALRIFNDENNVMNRNILDYEGEILSISQFTLYAETKKGNRPSYLKALSSDKAKGLYDYFNQCINKYINVETGIFGGDMLVSIQNDGPVTISLEM